jgi:cobalamin biosynthesis Mg chelatase CobN
MILPFRRANVVSDLTGSERVEQMRLALVVPTPMTREVSLVEKEQGRIVETATEARQAEPGPSILLVLIVSVVSAAAMLGAVWFVFFRT